MLRAMSLILLGCLCGLTVSVQAQDYEEAESLNFQGQYEECIDQASIAIASGDLSERWFILRINCQLTTGQYKEALDSLQEGLVANPNSIGLRLIGHRVFRLNNEAQLAKEALVEIEDLIDYRQWRYRDAVNMVAQGRFKLLKRVDAKEVMEQWLTPASTKSPYYAEPFLAIGQLGLAKHDYQLAADNFQKAAELQPSNPACFIGLAEAWRPSDLEKSSEAIGTAMRLNDRYLPGLYYLVDDRIDSETYDEAQEYIDRILKINPQDVKGWTYQAIVAHLQNDVDLEASARKKAFAPWDGNPDVDYLMGKKLSQKYRFAEGARMQRRALTYDPDHLLAKIQLANDLLRLGNAEEGWRLADEVYQRDGYNVVAYNLVTLGNKVSKYTALERDGFIVRMEPHEAKVYGQMVLDLLSEAKKELTTKYDVEVAEPIFVEIFPRQQDFAIRTFGLPGGSGYLGVCFGRVITMNSPKSQVRLGSNWKSVLWHEYCHVVTLQKTANKMPRWLSEGISVYEEVLKNPAWGQIMTPEYRERFLEDDFKPVSELSSAFLKASSGADVQFAYYESSLAVKFLIEKYGIDTLKRILNDLRVGMSINQALGRYAGDVQLVDKEFAEYAKQQAQALAPQANWDKPGEDMAAADLSAWQAWNQAHPDNIYGLRAELGALLESGDLTTAEATAKKFLQLYPGYRGADNGYAVLAKIALEKGDVESHLQMLKASAKLQAASTDTYSEIINLSIENQDWPEVSRQAENWLAVNPLIAAPHRAMALASEKTENWADASQSLQALTQMDPVDPAESFYRYALALQQDGRKELAIREVLKCLEEAPRYRQAHELFLSLVEEESESDSDQESNNDPTLPQDN